MGKPDITKFIKFDDLTDDQKKDLKKRFEERRQQLVKAIGLLDKGLDKLAKKPKR